MNTCEQVSCLVDGELSADDHLALSQSVLKDAEMSAAWVRYQQVRQLLQHDMAPDASGIAAQVHQALASEPTVFAPVVKKPESVPYRRWRLAIAASVVLLTIGLVPHWISVQDTQPDLVPIAQVSAPEQGQSAPAYLNRYLSEHHAYLGASHVTQPNGRDSVMAVRYVQ
ncbi:MAG: sigma-E factor negative regulatory protein [Pseudomonadota bacterium]